MDAAQGKPGSARGCLRGISGTPCQCLVPVLDRLHTVLNTSSSAIVPAVAPATSASPASRKLSLIYRPVDSTSDTVVDGRSTLSRSSAPFPPDLALFCSPRARRRSLLSPRRHGELSPRPPRLCLCGARPRRRLFAAPATTRERRLSLPRMGARGGCLALMAFNDKDKGPPRKRPASRECELEDMVEAAQWAQDHQSRDPELVRIRLDFLHRLHASSLLTFARLNAG